MKPSIKSNPADSNEGQAGNPISPSSTADDVEMNREKAAATASSAAIHPPTHQAANNNNTVSINNINEEEQSIDCNTQQTVGAEPGTVATNPPTDQGRHAAQIALDLWADHHTTQSPDTPPTCIHSTPGAYRIEGPGASTASVSTQPQALAPDVDIEANVEPTPACPSAWAVDDDVQVAVEIENRDELEEEEEKEERGKENKVLCGPASLNRNPKRCCFLGFIALCIIVGGVSTAAVLIPAKNKTNNNKAEQSRPTATAEAEVSTLETSSNSTHALHTPSMPTSVSNILANKHAKYLSGILYPIAFSGDCTVVATSLVDLYNGIVQTVQYDDANNNTTMSDYADEDDKWTLLDDQLDDGNTRGDRFGGALGLSYDGLIMAVAMPRDDPDGISDAGSVKVYSRKKSMKNSLQKWTPLGGEIHGDYPHGWMGTIISLSADGYTVATAAPLAGANKRGLARVHRYDTIDNEWKQVGSDIVGENSNSNLSYVRLSTDGNTLVVGAQHDATNDKNSGSLRIFHFEEDGAEEGKEGDWKQVGQSIYGERAGAQLGTFPHISQDGQVVATSGFGGNLLPQARIFSYYSVEDKWIQRGKDFDNMNCMHLSLDGERVIMCSVLLGSCSIHSFDKDKNDWEEIATFDDSRRFIPLNFSSDDGKESCGIGTRSSDGNEEMDMTTIAFYQLN